MKISDLQTTEKTEAIYNLDVGTITVFPRYIVSEIKEGETIGAAEIKEIASIVRKHFNDDKGLGFISNRIHPYAIIPTDLHLMSQAFSIPPKIAIVNYTERAKEVATYECNFWPTNIELFGDLQSAISWTSKSLELECA